MPLWSSRLRPHPGRAQSPANSALYGIEALSSNDIWAVGYKYQGSQAFPLVEHWDGAAWTIIPNPPNVEQSQMYGVAAVSPNDVWFVGQTWLVSDDAYILHWDGTSLQSVPPVNPGPYVALYAVAAVAANDVWAVGSYSPNGHDYFTLLEHWDGTRWSVVPSATGTYDTLTGITVLASNDIWAVGWDLTGAEILHWDGQTWTFFRLARSEITPAFMAWRRSRLTMFGHSAAAARPWPTTGMDALEDRSHAESGQQRQCA